MKIVYDNILNYATSLTATNQKSNRPVQNIIHPYLEKVFEAEGGTPTETDITAIFDEPQETNCFVYANHNITAISFVFRDDLDNIILSFIPNPSKIMTGNRLFLFPILIEGIYKIEIHIETTLSSTLMLGSLFLSTYLEMPRFNQGPPFSISLRSTSFISGSGQSSGNASVNLDNFPFSWIDIDYEKINEVKDYLEHVQTARPHWIDPYPDLIEINPQPDEKTKKFSIQYVQISEAGIPTSKRVLRDWKYNLSIQYRKAN